MNLDELEVMWRDY